MHWFPSFVSSRFISSRFISSRSVPFCLVVSKPHYEMWPFQVRACHPLSEVALPFSLACNKQNHKDGPNVTLMCCGTTKVAFKRTLKLAEADDVDFKSLKIEDQINNSTDEFQMNGIFIRWDAPASPNAFIRKYEIEYYLENNAVSKPVEASAPFDVLRPLSRLLHRLTRLTAAVTSLRNSLSSLRNSLSLPRATGLRLLWTLADDPIFEEFCSSACGITTARVWLMRMTTLQGSKHRICVDHSTYKYNRGSLVKGLASGNYSFRVRATSVGGSGNWTQPKSFFVKENGAKYMSLIISLIVIMLLIAISAGLAVYFYARKR